MPNYDDGLANCTVDIIPDKDSFLPRYLTVQLLEMLAKIFGNKEAIPNNASRIGEETC